MSAMKTLISSLVLTTLMIATSQAQNAPPGKASLQVQSAKKGAEKIAAPGGKVSGKREEPRVFYGGLLVDLANGKKSGKAVDLRSPVKPKPVRDNVYADPQSGAIKGFVVFAIKF